MVIQAPEFSGSTIVRCGRAFAFGFVTLLIFAGRSNFGQVEIVYDNTVHSLDSTLPVTGEIADEIRLGGIARNITDVQFEYFGQWTATGDEVGQLYFYLNDGAVVNTDGSRAPNTLFWESPLFNVSPGFGSIGIHDLNITVPDNFTVGIQFFGLTNQEQGQILLYDPPAVGGSFGDYWQKTGSTWGLYKTPGVRDNFSLRLTAAGPNSSDGGLIHVERVLNRLRLSWPGSGYRLQQSSNLPNVGGWIDIPFAGNSASVLIGTNNSFFRLVSGQIDGNLKVQALGAQIQITWSGSGYTLQQNDSPNDSTGWTNVTSGANSATISVGAGNKFFRLRKP